MKLFKDGYNCMTNNEVNLCNSCCSEYPTCQTEYEGIENVFGDGVGNDNICACNKYEGITLRNPTDYGNLR